MSNTDPVLNRTWQFNVNNNVTGSTVQDGGTTDGPRYRKQLLMDIKEALVGFGTLPWTVTQSNGFNSGIVIAPTVGSAGRPGDNFDPTDLTEIRWANTGVQHSWIVLENATLGMQICLDQLCDPAEDGALMNVYIAPVSTPFGSASAGTTTVRPISTLETQILSWFNFDSFGSWGSGFRDAAPRRYGLHVMHSTDGIASRVVVMLNNNPVGFWLFDRIEEQTGTLTYPFVARVAQANDDDLSSITVAHLFTNTRLYGFSNAGAGISYYMGMPGNNSDIQIWENIADLNTYDGRISLAPMCTACQNAGFVGVHGVLYDIWYATIPGYTGRGWPASTNALMQFGDGVFPWDGSIPLLS
jgi:hypothetical protein